MPANLVTRAPEILKTEGLGSFLFKLIRYPFKPALVPIASRSLRAAAKQARTLDDYAELAYRFKSCGITIGLWQMRAEILALLSSLQSRQPRVVVEIGTATGGTLFLFTRVAADDALLVSIDLPEAPFGGGYPRWRSRLYSAFARGRQRIELLRADSHDPATIEHLKGILRGRPIDFLFIDGDHSYAGVKQDFETYAPMVAKGGIIALHDIVTGPDAEVGGVPRFWAELRARYDVREFIANPGQASFGIGLLEVQEKTLLEAITATTLERARLNVR